MKNFILVDDNSIVRCIASKEVNLHKDKLHMKKYHVEVNNGRVGDGYNKDTNIWTPHPENYPKDTVRQGREKKIRKREALIIRNMAIAELIAEGKLPPDYT